MEKPPNSWRDDARTSLEDAFKWYTHWAIFVQLIRQALADDDYEAYLEALAWLQAEESEP